MAKGWRAAKPGSRNVQAPAVRSSCPYPGRAEPGAVCCAPPATSSTG
ncbi:hypothetical protein LV779_16825 [Streptomyces thinghirensis]|nr:hypothetical protein [Streptomyces thinghirensis]